MTNEASKPNRRKLSLEDFSLIVSTELFSIENTNSSGSNKDIKRCIE